MPDAPATPELDRLSAVAVEEAVLQVFLEWLSSKQYEIAAWDHTWEPNPRLAPISARPDSLIYEYLGIDPMKLERERRSLLEYTRTLDHCEGDTP